jgi:hypothetical protein
MAHDGVNRTTQKGEERRRAAAAGRSRCSVEGGTAVSPTPTARPRAGRGWFRTWRSFDRTDSGTARPGHVECEAVPAGITTSSSSRRVIRRSNTPAVLPHEWSGRCAASRSSRASQSTHALVMPSASEPSPVEECGSARSALMIRPPSPPGLWQQSHASTAVRDVLLSTTAPDQLHGHARGADQ